MNVSSRARSSLIYSDMVVVMMDVIVTLAKVLTDDEDPRRHD
jgi:hypothetical protein